MSKPFQGRVALVTGGGRGFGRAIALGLAEAGADVAVASRTGAQVETVAKEIAALGVRSIAVTGDVTKGEDVERIVRETETALGPIDIMVNNAGRPDPFGPISAVDPDAWWDAQKLHVLGPFRFMRAVLPGMRERGRGHIINVSSRGGVMVQSNLSAYCVGKAGLIRISEHAARENKDRNIAVFAIQPGDAHTELAEITVNSPDAQKYLPGMVAVVKEWKELADSQGALDRGAEFCVDLASGRLDALSGKYLEPDYDLDQMLNEVEDWKDRNTAILGGAKKPVVPGG